MSVSSVRINVHKKLKTLRLSSAKDDKSTKNGTTTHFQGGAFCRKATKSGEYSTPTLYQRQNLRRKVIKSGEHTTSSPYQRRSVQGSARHTHKKSQAGPDKPAPTNTKTKYGVHKTYLPLLTYGLTLTSPPTTTAIHLSRLAQTFREKSKSDSQKVYAALRPPAMHVDRSARRKIQARRQSRYRSRLSPTRDWKKKAPSAGPRYVRDASSQEAISPTRVSHPVAPTRTPSAF